MPTALPQLINDLLGTSGPELEKKGVTIENHIAPDTPLVLADDDRLKQIVLNLSNNATDAMPQGGTLRFRVESQMDRVVLDISDSGEGIPEGVDVFAPFYTSKPDGMGLGLAIVRQLVEAHHGSISYTSQPPQGTTFSLTLLRAEPKRMSHDPQDM